MCSSEQSAKRSAKTLVIIYNRDINVCADAHRIR
jgi:hypothetical protein